MTRGLEQKCCDNHPLLRQQRARVQGIAAVVASANESDHAGVQVFDARSCLVKTNIVSQPGNGGRLRYIPQPRKRIGQVADTIGDLLGDLAHVAVGVAVRRGGFNVLTFNVSGFGERQGATVQNQHGAILPHVPVLAGQRVRGKMLTNTAARPPTRRRDYQTVAAPLRRRRGSSRPPRGPRPR